MAADEIRKSNVRDRLIEAAYTEFSTKGILGATTRSIADRAGCNEVTLFRHFGSKEALLEASVKRSAADLLDVCRLTGTVSGELRKDLRQFAGIYDGVVSRTEGIIRALIGETVRIPDGVHALLGEILERFHGAMVGYLEEQQRAGKIHSHLDLALVAHSFTATLAMASLRRSMGHLNAEREAWLDHVAAMHAAALGGDLSGSAEAR